MKIAIPTLGRVNAQVTIKQIPAELKAITHLCCPEQEFPDLQKYGHPIIKIPDGVAGRIGRTREYIQKQIQSEHLLFLDDDLTFQKRNSEKKLKKANPEDFLAFYMWAQSKMKLGYPLAGMSAAAGNNRSSEPEKELERMYAVNCVNVKFLNQNNIRWDEIDPIGDFNIAISCIKTGNKNIINYEWAHSSPPNAKGGCSTYRNTENHKKSCMFLAEKHYPHVKIVKKNKSSWKNMKDRWDVKVQWKKIYADAVARLTK